MKINLKTKHIITFNRINDGVYSRSKKGVWGHPTRIFIEIQ